MAPWKTAAQRRGENKAAVAAGEEAMGNKRPKIVTLVGTNASGKSAAGIALARTFCGEIVSADSRQIYRGFDLCCGKVTRSEARMVPHHLLDVREVGEDFSVFDFQQLAYAAISQILKRGRLPFVVGGTGLYVSSVADGYVLSEKPPRAAEHARLAELPIEELRARLTPEAREFLAANPSDWQNKRRILRILEKTEDGEPLRPRNEPRYDVLRLGITWPREILHRRIDQRLKDRIAQGMIGEVQAYLDKGGDKKVLYDLGLEYRHILLYLTGEYSSMEEFRQELSRDIKRFAKRQMTWFRRDPGIHWLDMEADYLDQAQGLIREFLAE